MVFVMIGLTDKKITKLYRIIYSAFDYKSQMVRPVTFRTYEFVVVQNVSYQFTDIFSGEVKILPVVQCEITVDNINEEIKPVDKNGGLK